MRVGGWAFHLVLMLMVHAASAAAQTSGTSTATPALEDSSPERALAMAQAAFEYRDFAQVIAALDPWVHPPRIGSRARMIVARRLLGVSLHVEGNERAAREEFAQLLLLDPNHRLDPFVIPPQVIATFEDVRRQLEPQLGTPLPRPRSGPLDLRTVVVEVPHPAVVWMPFGIPQFVLDEPGTGVVLGLLQVLGLALNVAAFLRGESLPTSGFGVEESPAERDVWLGLQYSGLAVFGLAYGGSVVHGHLLVQERRRDRDAAQMSGDPLLPRVQLRF